ncbi:hypothetical protein [Chitinophaga sp. 212800010-3]|uniref:hypothetical protein n=1 Tax=unclassified Chitinophaga TaxID=2619133 RepID=UPI002DED3D8B|nr:Acid-shock protein [Chitinophaga sp. 212800010-3]
MKRRLIFSTVLAAAIAMISVADVTAQSKEQRKNEQHKQDTSHKLSGKTIAPASKAWPKTDTAKKGNKKY